MNAYFIDIFERMNSDQFNDEKFTPDEYNWGLAKSWYSKYANINIISNKELLDLLYFFYNHENFDLYGSKHFYQETHLIRKKYGIDKNDLLKMMNDFIKIIYKTWKGYFYEQR